MLSYYFSSSLAEFQKCSKEHIIGELTLNNPFDSTQTQNFAWAEQISIIKEKLIGLEGHLFFEFSIPRMGKRIDVLLIIDSVVFVLEFKVGESKYHAYQMEQVWDYALDLKNFHKPSHQAVIAPILIATEAKQSFLSVATTAHNDNLLYPISVNTKDLRFAIDSVLNFAKEHPIISPIEYAQGSYSPTPTIIEAAITLYNSHTVENITRSDAEAKNLTVTTSAIADIIEIAKASHKKIICFVTGVPGAGKTLVGLKVATQHLDKEKGATSVYLSGNAPLVAILQEALTRDRVAREKIKGKKITKKDAKQAVKSFIQIIHHYRDAYLANTEAPYDHVAIFDEAQRAWNKEQTINFMKRKKGQPDFKFSEPEFLISCLNRHQEWAVVVCLVGGGQEINTGEAGISEWLRAIQTTFPDWEVYISPNLSDSEYNAMEAIDSLQHIAKVHLNSDLHLSVSMRSFRAENLSLFVKHLLDRNIEQARMIYNLLKDKYPIAVTRDLSKAKSWLKQMARGSERYGMVVSSQALRLKPLAIDVKSPMNPVNWFLDGKDDIRSSYFLEDVATEFQVQGLELDWSCVCWDGDLRYGPQGWKSYSFVGNKWQNINKIERQKYLINAYRVLLTRARQGMVLVVPEGNANDHTRLPEFYDGVYDYLQKIGLQSI